MRISRGFIIALAAVTLCLVPFLAFTAGSGGSTSGSSAGSAGSGTAVTADDRYNKGVALSNAGNHVGALDQFQSAVSMRPDFAEAYNMLGFTYRKLGKISLSLQNYEKALKLKPAFPEAHEYLGETYLVANDLLHAVQQYIILKNGGKEQAQELWEKIADYVASKT